MTISAEQAAKLLEGTTPGPWMVGGVRCRIERNDTHSILRYDAEKKRDETIASVWYDPQTGLGRADARLIAAAPVLAAAFIDSEAARKLAEERLAKAVALLKEASNDLTVYVGADYPEQQRAKYPSVERQWQRDMALCHEIDTLLKEIDNG